MRIKSKIRVAAVCFPIILGGGVAVLPPSPAASPPPRLAAERTWLSSRPGYIFRIAYFNAEEEADSRWEAKRLEMMEQAQICLSGKKIARRDVKWYEPTPLSRRRCAAILYTVECDEPTNAQYDDLERDRNGLLAQEPASPIEADCGEKDRSKRNDPPVTSEMLTLAKEAKGRDTLAPRATCSKRPGARGDRLRILPDTRFSLETRVHPSLVEQRRTTLERIGDYLIDIPRFRISSAFRVARKPWPVIEASPQVPNDGTNVKIVQTFAQNRAGGGYCVQISARQGNRSWRKVIERDRLPEPPKGWATTFEGRSRFPDTYWSMETDAVDAAEALIGALGLELPPPRQPG